MLLMVCRHAEKCKYCNGPLMKIPLVNIILAADITRLKILKFILNAMKIFRKN